MTAAPSRIRLVTLSPADLAARLAEALAIYLEAMDYSHGTATQRGPLWLEHCRRPGWHAVASVDPGGDLVGVAYGYAGAPGQWWHHEVSRGLGAVGSNDAWLRDYFELTELHVKPAAQGAGLGEAMLRGLLARTDRARVLLSTPEGALPEPSRAWRLYRRLDFRDVLRNYRFVGDPRPFAVLGRALPLPPASRADPESPSG